MTRFGLGELRGNLGGAHISDASCARPKLREVVITDASWHEGHLTTRRAPGILRAMNDNPYEPASSQQVKREPRTASMLLIIGLVTLIALAAVIGAGLSYRQAERAERRAIQLRMEAEDAQAAAGQLAEELTAQQDQPSQR